MEEFKPGELVRSRLRASDRPLILLVVEALDPKPGFFRGVILIHQVEDGELYKPGTIADNWQTAMFERIDWAYFSQFLPPQTQ